MEDPGYDKDTRPLILTDELKAKLNAVATPTLAGALQDRGIENGILVGLKPTRPDLRLLGYAHTLRYVPKAPEFNARTKGRNMQRFAIETIEDDEVLIMEARYEVLAGTIGDIYSMRVKQRGGTGVITDGCLRDTPGITEIDLPVYHYASHGARVGRIHTALDHQVPIVCAGVTVFPGDILVGDAEGVCVLPARLVEEIADQCVEDELCEEWGLWRVSDGEPIDTTFPMHKSRQAEYEIWKRDIKGL